ncbi:glyoxylate reductase [Ramicandelaber brevisporus]|nr:glyoxylate reductase [Ramicandelaber brevisporus]
MTSAVARSVVPRVLVTRLLPPAAQSRLDHLHSQRTLDVVQWRQPDSIPIAELHKQIQGVDGLLCMPDHRINSELLAIAGPQLKVVSTMTVGYDHINVEDCRNAGVKIGNTPEVLTDATAEVAVLLTLMTARKAREAMATVKENKWGPWKPTHDMLGMQLTKKTVGILGYGRIGKAIAERLAPFGIERVICSGSSSSASKVEQAVGAGAVPVTRVPIQQLFGESDVLILSCALTKETTEIVNKDAFELMKPSSILINIARGQVVDQAALLDALNANKIAGAGLDVTTPEPLRGDHPLAQHPNCTILPHIGSATLESRNAMGLLAVDNLVAGAYGKPLPKEVN